MIAIIDVKPEHVRSVYSGRIGCCCGCRGKHTVNPAHRDEAAKHRGFPVAEEDMSLLKVKNVIKKVQSASNDPAFATLGGVGYCVDISERTYVVYLTKNAAKLTRFRCNREPI